LEWPGATTDELIAALNRATGNRYVKPFSQSRRITILTRLQESAIKAVFDDESRRMTIRRLMIGDRIDVLLAAVHFQSRVNWTEDDQGFESTNLARDLVKVEDDFGYRRTILVGDLNMNPFDKGMVAAHGLHAVMTRQIADKETRTVSGKEYPFFYNPMWGHFGDRTHGPAGTHYYDGGQPVTYFWNMYDQVLLRPELAESLEELQILDGDGVASFLSKSGRPDNAVASDHLPVMFRLNI
jgi:hypothetical protein